MPTSEKPLTEEARGPEGIVRMLEDAGIDMVFGIAGDNMGRLYDALYHHQDSVRTVPARHEQLASTFSDMNFANVAKAMGVNGIRVEAPSDLAGALNEALAAG